MKRSLFLNLLAMVFSLVYVGLLIFKDSSDWLLVLMSLAFLIVANADTIKKWKIGKEGFEAETREVLTQTRNTLEEVKELATLVASTTLSLVKRAGRFGGYEDKEADSIRNDVFRLLRQLGVAEDRIANTLTEWHRFVEHDYRLAVTGGPKIPSDLPRDKKDGWDKIRKGGIDTIATPDEIEAFFISAGMLTDERRELLADYRYYRQHREHRRLDIWARREELFFN